MEENTYEFGLVVGTKKEREYWEKKIKEKIEEKRKAFRHRTDIELILEHEFIKLRDELLRGE